MVLMCVECWTSYDDPKVSTGHYGVCKACNKEEVKSTPGILKEEFAKMFEGEPPSAHRIQKLIKAGLDHLRDIQPLGSPEVDKRKQVPRSRRIFFEVRRHDQGFKKD